MIFKRIGSRRTQRNEVGYMGDERFDIHRGIEALATAIIKLAVEDYMDDYSKFIVEPTLKGADYIRLRRRYFEENCCGLTAVGDAIVEKAESLVREKFSEEKLSIADGIYSNMLLACA